MINHGYFDLINIKYSEKELEEKIKLHDLDDWDWENIFACQRLSCKFIDKYSDKLNNHTWVDISKYQTLSESFIEKYSDKVHWGEVSFRQELSEEFIRKNSNKIIFHYLMKNDKIPSSIKDKIEKEIGLLKEII
jgi:hypothetical protein